MNVLTFIDYATKERFVRKPKQIPGKRVCLVKEHSRGEHMVPIPKGSIGKVGKSKPLGPDHSIVCFEGFGYYHIHLKYLRMVKEIRRKK